MIMPMMPRRRVLCRATLQNYHCIDQLIRTLLQDYIDYLVALNKMAVHTLYLGR